MHSSNVVVGYSLRRTVASEYNCRVSSSANSTGLDPSKLPEVPAVSSESALDFADSDSDGDAAAAAAAAARGGGGGDVTFVADFFLLNLLLLLPLRKNAMV